MKKLLIVMSLLLVTTSTFAQLTKEKYQKIKIFYNEDKPLSLLSSLGLSVDHGIHKKGFFYIAEFSESEVAIVQENGFEVEILISDA